MDQKMSGMSVMSTYPVVPKQLTWVMDKCVHKPENENAADPTKRCNGCGPASNAFALGVSSEFSGATGCHAVFYERVQCDNANEYLDNGREYIRYRGHLYHVITTDYSRRIDNDLEGEKATVDALYDDVETFTGRMKDSKPFTVNGKDVSFKYFIADAGKFYVPVFADYLSKDNLHGGKTIAILVGKTEGQEEINALNNGEDSDIKSMIEGGIFRILERVTNKCRVNSMELLYMKQHEYLSSVTQALSSYDYLSARAPVGIADELFSRISIEFGLAECVLFMPGLISETHSDAAYSARVYRDGKYIEDSGYSLKIADIDQEAINAGKIDISMIRNMNALSGVEFTSKNNAYDFYIQRHEMSGHNNDDHKEYIAAALLLCWKEPFAPYGLSDNGAQHDPVFNSVMQTLCSSLLAGAVTNKQLVLNVFQESTQHDLAQKLETISLQNNEYKSRLQTYYFNSGWQSEEEFYDASRSYQGYVERLLSHIRFFERGLSQPNLNQEPEYEQISIYTDLLYDIKRVYSFEHAGRHAFIVLKPRQRLQNELRSVYADVNMLERILVNLLDNAFKYAYEYSNVYLDYYMDGDNAVFDVISYNGGIPDSVGNSEERIRDRIFDRGYRYAVDINKKPGRGAGLYTARGFARKHTDGVRAGDVVIIDDVHISDYHVPALEEAIVNRILSEQDDSYQQAEQEYKRLRSNTSNLVAVENNRRTLLSDVGVKPPRGTEESDNHTETRKRKGNRFDKNFYKKTMRNKKTYRVTFRVTIPQQKAK